MTSYTMNINKLAFLTVIAVCSFTVCATSVFAQQAKQVAGQMNINQLSDQQIRAGMPVEIFIRTGERSLMSYLFKPILDRAHSALSEE